MHRWSAERFEIDQEILESLTSRFLAAEFWQKPRNQLTEDEHAELHQMIAELRHPRAIEELCAMAATHPNAGIRRSIMEAIEPFLAAHPAARELVVWLLGDDEDFVVFSAARLAGRNRIGEAYEELEHITGPAKAGEGCQLFNAVDNHPSDIPVSGGIVLLDVFKQRLQIRRRLRSSTE